MRTVATFNNPTEAQMLAAHLGGSGIEAVLRDENTVQADLLLASAIGGVKVDVADADFERALAVARDVALKAESSPKIDNRRHRPSRYLKTAALLFPTIFVMAEWLIGWISIESVLGCSLVIAAGIAAFLALFDL